MRGGKAMDAILDYIANIGLDAIKDKITNPVMEVSAKNKLDNFLIN